MLHWRLRVGVADQIQPTRRHRWELLYFFLGEKREGVVAAARARNAEDIRQAAQTVGKGGVATKDALLVQDGVLPNWRTSDRSRRLKGHHTPAFSGFYRLKV